MSARTQKPAPTTWSAAEPGFLAAVAAFDNVVTAEGATEGERQNGKGD